MRIFGFMLAGTLLMAFATPEAARLGSQERGRAQAQPAAQAAKPSESQPAPPPPPPPPPPPAPSRNIQVDVTVSLEGGATPMSKRMTLVAAENSVALGRSGIEIAVPTSTFGPGGANPAPVTYSYRSVGLNIDARPRITDANKVLLMLKLEFSAVLKPEGAGSGMPAFGKSNTELNLVLDSGKPLVITNSADAEIGRGYSVEVKATVMR